MSSSRLTLWVHIWLLCSSSFFLKVQGSFRSRSSLRTALWVTMAMCSAVKPLRGRTGSGFNKV